MNVEELLSEKLILYRSSGKDFIIRCLNREHDDTNPSMRVDKESGVFHCFSCGYKGQLHLHYGMHQNTLDLARTRLLNKIKLKRQSVIGQQMPSGAMPYEGNYREIAPWVYKEFGAFTASVSPFTDRLCFPVTDITKKIVASTAAGVAGALSLVGTIGPVAAGILAGLIGAMGVAQIAIISKLKYGGGVGATEAAKPTNLQIGQRSNAVDVSQGATAGELSYLRGTTGTASGGAGASFPGAAMGRKSYADGGVVVGERGPEVIAPSTPVDIIPNYALEGQSTNVNFTINALDASGVEDVLMGQQGNIIRMIRQAANENGENFLPNVDTMAYGSKT